MGHFWHWLESRSDFSAGALDREFERLSPMQRRLVHRGFRAVYAVSRTRLLWAAASVVAGTPAGDDTFGAFRRGLILLGRETFERALAMPDDLAAIADRMGVDLRDLFVEDLGSLESADPADERDAPAASGDHHYTDSPREAFAADLPLLWQRFADAFNDGSAPPVQPSSFIVPGLGEVREGQYLVHAKGYGRCRVGRVLFASSRIAELEFADQVRKMKVSSPMFRRAD